MNIAIPLAAGVGLGVFFYGGLWLTVRALLTARHPALIVLPGFVLRTLIALSGFVLAMRGSWVRGLLAIAGFAVGRWIVALLLPRPGGEARCT